MPRKKELAVLDEIIERHRDTRDPDLILLQEVQKELGYVGKEYLEHISKRTGIPLTKLFGVVTFYPQLKLHAPGRHTIKVCQGTACHVRGGARVLREIEKELKIKPDQTTEDGRFSMESVRCLGCCGLSPVIMVNNETFGRMKSTKVSEVLSKYE